MTSPLRRVSWRVRLLPYPAGKLFAFTIIDDTDGQTLAVTRAVYDELLALGFRTTKTVWVTPPSEPPAGPWDEGDTLEDPRCVEYHVRLQTAGFEIALHNVSSRSNRRQAIASGLERFREVFGTYPRINVHHEKNSENIYFDVANTPGRLPGVFRSPLFRMLRSALRALRPSRALSPPPSCSGENVNSEFFWADICKEKVRYVRSNVFVSDLNTVRVCPAMPVHYPDTPGVNYWFYSSEGQDAAHFNRILSNARLDRLRRQHGAAIVYTHFGKGFVTFRGGRPVLNEETRSRLRRIAASEDGWLAPVGELLDRLLLFQRVFLADFGGGIIVRNDNDEPVRDVTLLMQPEALYFTPEGRSLRSDTVGRLVLPEVPAAGTVICFRQDPAGAMKTWLAGLRPELLADLGEVAARIRDRIATFRLQRPEWKPQRENQ